MAEIHRILGDKVRVYQRDGTPLWYCSTYLAGKNRRVSTKEESLAKAKDFAEDWFFSLLEKNRSGEILGEKTFKTAAERFMHEYEALTVGERNPRWVKDHYRRIIMHLIPFFGEMGLSQVSAGTVQDYRIFRTRNEEGKKVPSRSTLHHDCTLICVPYNKALD